MGGMCTGPDPYAEAPSPKNIDNEKPDWEIMQRRQRVFEERTKTKEIKVAAGKIADSIVGSIATVASGGALSAVLINGLRDVVINASWSSCEKQETIREQLFDDDTLVFVEITKSSTSIQKKIAGFGSNIVLIKADTKYSYMKAGNEAAREKLRAMKRKQAQDVSKYIDDLPGWHDDE